MVCADPDCATIAALNSVNKHEYFCIVKDQLTRFGTIVFKLLESIGMNKRL